MADNEGNDTKGKRTVPAMVRTARGVADHAAAVLEMQWDKERKSFKDPITVSLALFTYAKLTAALLDEAEARINSRDTALEVRIEKLETQIAAFEAWREDVAKQAAEAEQKFEEMLGNDQVTKLKELITAQPPVLEMKPAPEANGDTSTVLPLKPAAEKHRGEKGGAA